MRRKLETGLAVGSLVAAAVHVVLEWRFHRSFGQFLPNLWIHLFAAGLMVFAAMRVLRGPGALGPLCAAWGLTTGLVWLAFTTVAQRLLEARVSESHVLGIQILAASVLVSLVGLALSLALSLRREEAVARPAPPPTP